MNQLEWLTGRRKSTLYRLMEQGAFPRPIEISPRVTAWSEAAVLQWMQGRTAAAIEANPAMD